MRYYGIQNEVKAYLNRLQSETSIQVTPSIVKTLNDRVESLKKSGVWSQYSLGFNDVDADSYFQRASVNDIIGRSEVCWFVRGMKSLGLWQNMVSWPLRSYQNAGTGSTVYSLGGLGTFNGTMVNSPTWGANGVINSATGRIDTDWMIDGGGQAHIFVGNSTTASAVRCYGGTLSNINTRGTRFRDDMALWGDGGLRGVNVNLSSIGNFKMAAALYNRPETGSVFLNAVFQIGIGSFGEVISGTNPLSMLNARDAGSSQQFYSGQAALYMTIMRRLTPINYNFIYNLYRSTLGSNLGLP